MPTIVHPDPNRDDRPISRETGHLYSIFFEMQKSLKSLQSACDRMAQAEPWYDKNHRKKKSKS